MTSAAEGQSAAAANPASAAWWRSPRGLFALKLGLLLIATILVLLYRRPDQFLIPAVWAEEGTICIPDYVARGWASLLHPIQGYYSLPIRLVHALAETLSFRWLPEVEYGLIVLCTCGVLVAVAVAPTALRWPFVCAATTLAIPSDSEVFGVALFAGFWCSLLLLLPLLWRDTDRRHDALRLGFVAFGGLSSPLVIGIAPLYALRALVKRTRIDGIAFCVCAAVAVLQFLALRRAGMIGGNKRSFDIGLAIQKFFGYFLIQPATPVLVTAAFYLGAALIAFMVVAWLRNRRELGLPFLLLGGALGVAMASSMARIPVEMIHPKLAGPRYFFTAFVVLSWLLVQIAASKEGRTRVVAIVVLAVAARNAVDVAQRRHESIAWRAHVAQCLESSSHAFPIHIAGQLTSTWTLVLSGEQCRRLVSQSLFDNPLPP